MITLPEHLEQPFKRLAEQQHQSADKLLAQLVEEYLEDYHDIQLAEQTLKEIERGEVKVLSLAEAWTMLNDLDN
jgi:predicted DNA-binding protein